MEAWLLSQPGVKQASVHERTFSVTVLYENDRAAICRMLAGFSFEKAASQTQPLTHSSRAMNREFKEKLVCLVLCHYARRLFLPAPVRRVLGIIRSIPRIFYALKALAHRRMTVEVLDVSAIKAIAPDETPFEQGLRNAFAWFQANRESIWFDDRVTANEQEILKKLL